MSVAPVSAATMSESPVRIKRHANRFAVLFTAPALAFFTVFALIPVIVAVYLSFLRWDGISQPTWIGLKNWANLFSDPVTGHAIALSIEIMVLSWIIETPIALLLGVFLAAQQRYRALLGIFYFVPLLFSTVAIGITWVSLLDPNFGLIDVLLKSIGLPGLSKGWLGDPNLAFYVVTCVIAWQFIPFHALLYLAGARQIPQSLYEAARIDGAGVSMTFFSITLPQLRYTIVTSTVLILTGALTYFDLIWVMTQGGPGFATRILPVQMYISAFQNQLIGYGSMLAVLLAAAGITLSFILLRVTGFTKMASQLEGL
jgi:raffinose/stachyose/melibiose transport system permease protein